MKTGWTPKKTLILTLFIVYLLIVLKLTIFRGNTHYAQRQLNLTLLTDLLAVYQSRGFLPFARLFFGNIGWFVPFGFLLPLLLKKSRFFKTIGLGFAFSLFIEITQYISYKGVAELDDLLLNTLGTAIGYGLFWVVWRRTRGTGGTDGTRDTGETMPTAAKGSSADCQTKCNT